MNLHKQLLTKNACYKSGKIITPKGIMVHSTGANNPKLNRYIGPDDGLLGAPSPNNWNQEYPGESSVCVHAFIGKLSQGDIATYQTLPWNMRGWHCGKGSKGSANDSHISFEICEDNLTDETYFNKVYREAVEFCAYLCEQFGFNPTEDGVIICHSEGYKRGIASNHSDVMHWFPKFGKDMDTFRNDVKDEMENEEMTQEQFNSMMDEYLKQRDQLSPSSWSSEQRGWAEKNGLIVGDDTGNKRYKGFCTREEIVTLLYRNDNLK